MTNQPIIEDNVPCSGQLKREVPLPSFQANDDASWPACEPSGLRRRAMRETGRHLGLTNQGKFSL